jgi:sugar/nucleoside kinase (ribokinase family)
MNTYLGISQELTEQDIDMKIIEESSMLYLEGYLWDLDNAKKAIRKAIETARKSNAM